MKIIKKAILLSAVFGVTFLNRSNAEEFIPNFPEDVMFTIEDQVVANTILGEARGEGLVGMMLVADVLYERVFVHERWKTPALASKARGQFEGASYYHNESDLLWFQALRLAKAVNRGKDILPNCKFTQFRAWKQASVPNWATNVTYYKGHVLFNEPRDNV